MEKFKGVKWVAFNDRVEDWSGNMHTKICDVTTGRDKTANQNLIASAPELLEALQELVFTSAKLWDQVKPIKDSTVITVTHPIIEEAKQAINKALNIK